MQVAWSSILQASTSQSPGSLWGFGISEANQIPKANIAPDW
jgi:hypothetical protein